MDRDTILFISAELLGPENDPRKWPEDWQNDFVEDMQSRMYLFGLLGFKPADRLLRALDSLIALAHEIHGGPDIRVQ